MIVSSFYAVESHLKISFLRKYICLWTRVSWGDDFAKILNSTHWQLSMRIKSNFRVNRNKLLKILTVYHNCAFFSGSVYCKSRKCNKSSWENAAKRWKQFNLFLRKYIIETDVATHHKMFVYIRLQMHLNIFCFKIKDFVIIQWWGLLRLFSLYWFPCEIFFGISMR